MVLEGSMMLGCAYHSAIIL